MSRRDLGSSFVTVRTDRLQFAAVVGAGAVGTAEALSMALDAFVTEDRITVIAAQGSEHRTLLLHWSAA